ncbi:MAG: family 20 glycosylhydrolase, partial [Planctomycetia bacterium]|nr:family 20 glycosylhydrolase [Planctomycetia bacterium]
MRIVILGVASLIVLAFNAFCSAFEPPETSEVALYNARLIPAPRDIQYGNGVVVFNRELRCILLTSNDEAQRVDATDLDALRASASKDFGVELVFERFSIDEFMRQDDEAPQELLDFTQRLADDAEFFKTTNAYRMLALADPSAKDATVDAIVERRNQWKGTLVIAGSDLSGIRDAFKTLRQLSETFAVSATIDDSSFFIPEIKVDDAPRLSFRGLHLCWFPETKGTDIERSIRIAAYYKFNYIVLEFWGVFPFDACDALCWSEFHTTKAEVARLVKVGKELGVRLIPQFNLFGHAPGARVASGKHAILDFHPEYEPLFEPDGWTWNVYNPATRELLTKCVWELFETFEQPPYFHIGCDEAYSAGSNFVARRRGDYPDALADWITYFRNLLNQRDCRVMMWHDMLIEGESFPGYTASGNEKTRGLLEKLPKDIIICDWQYGAPKKDETWPTLDYFTESGFDVLACPWLNLEGIRSLAGNVIENDRFGVLCTTWHKFYNGDMPRVLAVGAQACWGTKYQGSAPFGNVFNRHLRQASRDVLDKDYRTGGVGDWQVPKDVVV